MIISTINDEILDRYKKSMQKMSMQKALVMKNNN